LGVGILTKDGAAKSSQEFRPDVVDGRLARRRLGVEMFVEEMEVEVGFGGQRVESPAVELAHPIYKHRGEGGALGVLSGVVEIYLDQDGKVDE